MCSGPRARYGLPSPSLRIIERGDPIVVGHGLMGALNCRAGWMVASADELQPAIRDYIDKLVAPYFSAAVAWYETLGIGVTGVAGPDEQEGKPVGTVHIALDDSSGDARVESYQFAQSREMVKRRAVTTALSLLRRTLVQ
jgi:hypothetical protein